MRSGKIVNNFSSLIEDQNRKLKFIDVELHLRDECMSEFSQTITLKKHRRLFFSALDLIQCKTRKTCLFVARLHVETR